MQVGLLLTKQCCTRGSFSPGLPNAPFFKVVIICNLWLVTISVGYCIFDLSRKVVYK